MSEAYREMSSRVKLWMRIASVVRARDPVAGLKSDRKIGRSRLEKQTLTAGEVVRLAKNLSMSVGSESSSSKASRNKTQHVLELARTSSAVPNTPRSSEMVHG